MNNNENTQFIEIQSEGSFARGMIIGAILSIPLWFSMFGWVKLIKNALFPDFM